MKRIIMIIQIIILATGISFGQRALEAKFTGGTKTFLLPDGTLKNIKADLKKKQLLVFDNDNNLENTISIDIPSGHKIKDIILLNHKTEAGKNSLSVLYTSYYVAQKPIDDFADRFHDQQYTLNVVDAVGNYLLKIPNTTGYQLLSSENSNKLLVYQTVRKGFKTKRFTEVYGL